MACNNFTDPIPSVSTQLTVPSGTFESLSSLSHNLDPETRRVLITFEKDTGDTSEPQNPLIIGRYWEDGTDPTATEGHSIITLTALKFSLAQASSVKFFAIDQDLKFNISEYKLEV